MKTIIAGSRYITDMDVFKKFVDLHKQSITEIISGGARGVDTLAIEYAKANKIPYRVFMADWNKFGKPAGVYRNMEMAQEGEQLLALWDGHSKGTRHMIEIMTNRDKPVQVHIVGITN